MVWQLKHECFYLLALGIRELCSVFIFIPAPPFRRSQIQT